MPRELEVNIIYCEDCLIGMDRIPDKSVNLILTDLPYGVTAQKWDSIVPIDKLWAQYKRIITDNGVVVLFGQEPFSSTVRTSNLEMYRYDIKWLKHKPSNFQLMGYQPGRVTEDIMVFSKAKACYTKGGNKMTYNPQLTLRDKPRKANAKIYGDGNGQLLHDYDTKDNFKTYDYRQPTNVVRFNAVTRKKVHPTEKPVNLLEYLIKTYSNEGDVVLDSCMGSGGTCVAAANTKRKYIGFEIEEEYFEIAKNRLNNGE